MTPAPITIDDVQRAVAELYGVPVDVISGKDRSWGAWRGKPRKIAIVAARKLTDRSLLQLARGFRRDRKVVMRALAQGREIAPSFSVDLAAIKYVAAQRAAERAASWSKGANQ